MSMISRVGSLLKILMFLIALEGCILSNRDISTRPPLATGKFPAELIQKLVLDSRVVSQPTTGDNFFLVRTETSLYKFEVDGVREWQVKYPGYMGMHPPVILDDLVVVPTDIGQFIVLSVNDGSLKWRGINQYDLDFGHNIEDIAFSENILVVAKFNSHITAYNIDNGQILWAHEIPERSSAYLVIENGIVYMAADKFLIAYDTMTGKELWKIDFNTFVGPIVSAKSTLILVLGPPQRTEITVIDLFSRETLWRKHTKGVLSDAHGGIIVDSESIYITGNKVIALSLNDGKTLWESEETEQLGKPMALGQYLRQNR